MIVLDTNVVSELMRDDPDVGPERWVARQVRASLFLTAVSEAELRYGVALLPAGRRRGRLSVAIDGMIHEDFAGRILPFDSAAAEAYATIAARRRAAGRPISIVDCQIAAIAASRGAAVATRNVDDFENCGIDVLNPWEDGRRSRD